MKFLFPFFLLFFITWSCYAGQADSLAQVVDDYIETTNPSLPLLDHIIEENISDVSICKGPSSTYYLTGTCGDRDGVQEGIKVWASRDLKDWNSIGTDNYVWTFKDGVPWQREISTQNGWQQRGIIAPEIHYLKGTFWITYTNSNSNQSGILRSISGRAQGPYVEVSGQKPLLQGSNVSLFMDTDSSVYVIWSKGFIQRFSDDMTSLTSANPRILTDSEGNQIDDFGIHIVKIEGKYILTASRWINKWDKNQIGKADQLESRCDGVLAISNDLFGPYTFQSVTFPHAGGGSLFTDFEGNPYFTISGVDVGSPISGHPCLLPLEFDQDKQFNVKNDQKSQMNVVYVSTFGNNSNGNNWQNAYTNLQRAIDNSPDGSQIWIAAGRYDAPIQINLRYRLYLYGGFKGDEDSLEQRDSEKNKVFVMGKNSTKHVFTIWTSRYIRLEGLTIKNGNATGGSFHQQYGGGVHIMGGGETIKLVNCSFEANKANLDGGALYASVGAAPILINCSFNGNISMNNGGAVAVYCNALNGYQAQFYNCKFQGNYAFGDGGAIYFDSNSRDFGLLTLVNCLVANNESQKSGGVITLDRNSNLLMLNSTLCFNKGTSQGAVIASLGKVPARSRVVNSIFYHNEGGSLFSIEGEAEMVTTNNRLISPNIWVQMVNSLFDGNMANALVQRNFDRKKWRTVAELNESVLGKNCLSGDASFIDEKQGDFHLSGSSKARNTGTSSIYFPFNIDGERRDSDRLNVGCY